MKSILLSLLFVTGAFSLSAQIDLEVALTSLDKNQSLSGITVYLKNTSINLVQQNNSDANGRVRFFGLPPGSPYEIWTPESDSLYSARITDIDLRSNTNQLFYLPLSSKKSVSLNTLVVSGASRLNNLNAEVSSEIKQKELENLPIEGRDITRALYRLPNVVQATGFYPEAPNVSINGANSLFTNYLIDGMDNNERFLGGMKCNLPLGMTRNINVLTNNFSTEYGLSANGVVNVTTRSGANAFGGEAFFITRPGPAIDAASPYAQRDLSGNAVKDGFQRYQAGIGFGGPIRAGKTFYYFNFEHTTDLKDNLLRSPELGVNDTVRGKNQFTYLSARLDQRWSPHFQSAMRLNIGIVNIQRQGGGLEGGVAFPSSGSYQDRNSLLIANQNTYLGDRFKSETNLQYSSFRWNYARPQNQTSPQVVVLDPSEQTIAVIGHPGYYFDETESTGQLQQKFTFYTDRHKIKTGIEWIGARHQLLGGGNENGNYTVKLTNAQLSALRNLNKGADLNVSDIPSDAQVLNYSVELRPQTFGTTQHILSAYLEDEWAAGSSLILTLGLRYDYDNLSKGGAAKGDYNNLAPRFSFNYRLNNHSSLRGGYGIFYDKIPYAIYSDALQQNTTGSDYKQQLQSLIDQGILPATTDLNRITFDGNLSASASGVSYLQGPSSASLQDQRAHAFSNERRILNPNGYQNPYSHQFTLGYQTQWNDKMLFYVNIVHNRSYQLFRLRDLNSPTSYPLNDPDNVVVRTSTEADLTRPVPIYGNYAIIHGDTLYGVARNIVVSESAGEARYWGLSCNLQKERGDDNYSWRLIYTLSRLENNTEDINFKAQDANRFEAEWGPSINDRTHVINAIFNYYPFKNWTITLAALLQSGQPINRIPDALVYGTTDLNGDGRSFGDAYVGNSDRQPGEKRNSDRLPWSNTFDLSTEYRLPFGLVLRADVFNLFNAENLSGYSNNATQSNQIQAGPKAGGLLIRKNAAPPRQFQFGLRFVF